MPLPRGDDLDVPQNHGGDRNRWSYDSTARRESAGTANSAFRCCFGEHSLEKTRQPGTNSLPVATGCGETLTHRSERDGMTTGMV